MLAFNACSAVRPGGLYPRARPGAACRPQRPVCTVAQVQALHNHHGSSNSTGPSPAALKLAGVLAAAALALHPLPALAGGVEKLESEELPSLVEALGSLRDPEQASSAAAQISEVESQVTQLDEAEQAKGETAVQGEANAITDAIDALKEALGVQ